MQSHVGQVRQEAGNAGVLVFVLQPKVPVVGGSEQNSVLRSQATPASPVPWLFDGSQRNCPGVGIAHDIGVLLAVVVGVVPLLDVPLGVPAEVVLPVVDAVPVPEDVVLTWVPDVDPVSPLVVLLAAEDDDVSIEDTMADEHPETAKGDPNASHWARLSRAGDPRSVAIRASRGAPQNGHRDSCAFT